MPLDGRAAEEEIVVNHRTHLYLMGGLVFVGLLILTGGGGFGGGGLFLLILLAFCLAMLFVMMRLMGGGMSGMAKRTDAGGSERGTAARNEFEDGGFGDDVRGAR
ncbi:MAG: hypothetical protein M3Y04_05465 [Actinomycetota bacterium]|nr:hypothetical protein [Actinomycetota bacterium]